MYGRPATSLKSAAAHGNRLPLCAPRDLGVAAEGFVLKGFQCTNNNNDNNNNTKNHKICVERV